MVDKSTNLSTDETTHKNNGTKYDKVQLNSLMDLQYTWELERFNEWNESYF
jgi:hypothetical protein